MYCCTLMIVSVKLFRFILYKNLLLSIIYCSAAMWDSVLCFLFFYLFLLLYPLFFFQWHSEFSELRILGRHIWYQSWRLSENLGSVWELLIRDRVSSTLEWDLRVIIDMSAYLLVNVWIRAWFNKLLDDSWINGFKLIK